MTTSSLHPAINTPGVTILSDHEIDSVAGGSVDWKGVARFAGRAAGTGVRLGVWGLAGAAVATAVYVAIDAADD